MNESDHAENIQQLRRALQVMKDFRAEIKGARTFEIIDALGSLQQSMCAAGGMSLFIMQLLAREVEEHLAPCPDA